MDLADSLADLPTPPLLSSPHSPARRPRAILIEQYGQLVGLITVKDCLKYTLAHEASHEAGAASKSEDELEQTLEDVALWIREVKSAVKEWVTGKTGRRRVRLAPREEESEVELETPAGSDDGRGSPEIARGRR